MKIIRYTVRKEVNHGTEEHPVPVPLFLPYEIQCPDDGFAPNYEMAQREAYNGEVTVEDLPDPETEPSQEEDTAAMLVDHEFRLTLLELGVTE